jgi:hypothetical protein
MIASELPLPQPCLEYQVQCFQLSTRSHHQASQPSICIFSQYKLTSSQQNYSTIKKEKFSGVDTFEEYYCSILKGTVIQTHHGHNNLTYKNLCTEGDSNWCKMINTFCPNLIYKWGKEQIVADCLSQHPQFKEAAIHKDLFYKPPLNAWNKWAEAIFDSFFYYSNDAGAFPLNLPDITTAQHKDPVISIYLLNNPERFKIT